MMIHITNLNQVLPCQVRYPPISFCHCIYILHGAVITFQNYKHAYLVFPVLSDLQSQDNAPINYAYSCYLGVLWYLHKNAHPEDWIKYI